MRTISRIGLGTAVVMVISMAFAPAGECPDIGRLRASYQNERFIALDFVQLTYSDVFDAVDTVKGSVWVGWEGRFRLNMPEQELVSNGVLYWSYSAENRQVLVDSVARLGRWNPLTLLYDPEQVYRCRGQKTAGDRLEFEMTAFDSVTVPRQFTLQVAKNGYEPKALVYYDDNDSRIEVRITDFSRRSDLPDSLFEFHPGPGVEVITMP